DFFKGAGEAPPWSVHPDRRPRRRIEKRATRVIELAGAGERVAESALDRLVARHGSNTAEVPAGLRALRRLPRVLALHGAAEGAPSPATPTVRRAFHLRGRRVHGTEQSRSPPRRRICHRPSTALTPGPRHLQR